MADEGQTPRYSSASSGSNQVVQETNDASSTPDNASEDPQIRLAVTPEAQRPLHTTSACSSDTVQPGTSSAVILDESAGSDNEWTDMLNDLYEKIIGSPQIAPLPVRTNNFPLNTAHDMVATTPEHEYELQYGSTASWNPMDSTGASLTPSSASQESLVQGPGTSGNSARTTGATSNFQWNREYHQAEHPYSYCDVCDNGSAGAQNPTSIRSDWDTVAKTSRADIVQPSTTPENYSRVPPRTLTLQSNAAHGHIRMSQYEVASLQPSASSGDDSIAVLESMVRRLEINEESFTLIHGAWNRGGAYNVQPVLEHGEAFSHVSTYATGTESSGLPVPASSGGACHSIPITGRGSIEEIIQGYDARIGTASTQTGMHEDISGVNSHVNHGMKTSGERRPKRELCGNSFKKKHHLAIHRHVRTGEKPYHCSICGKSFSRKDNLDVHHRIHACVKPYHCDMCVKSFSRQGDLYRHRRTHTGEKPFKCTTCTMSFAQKGNLRVHERIHTREKPFKCTTCTMSFTQQGHLRVHERTHTGERPYKCKMCEYSSTTSSHLKKHQRTHRNKKP